MDTAPEENGKKVLTMSEYFAGGHLRFVDGEWRDDDGNMIEISTVRHGRWLPQVVLGQKAWDCSECKTLGSPHWKWCPVCGAKMDGGFDNETY